MRIAFRTFGGGQASPTLASRYDLKKAGTFLESCRNFVINLHGDAERRPGTEYVAELGSGSNSVIVPFCYNSEPENCYCLIFQHGAIKIYNMANGMCEAKMDNPYSMPYIYELSLAQVADVLYIAHRLYPLRKITRSGAAEPYTWKLQSVTINQSLDAPARPFAKWMSGTGTGSGDNMTASLRYKVCAVDKDGVESVGSAVGACTGRYPTDWIAGDRVRLTWPLIEGATEYNIFRESAGYYGFIGVSKETMKAERDIAESIQIGEDTYKASTTKYDASMDMLNLKISLGDYPIFSKEGASKFYVYNSGAGKWYAVDASSGLDGQSGPGTGMWGTFEEWTGDQNSGAYPSGTSGGVTIEPGSVPVRAGDLLGLFWDQNYEPDTAKTPSKNWNPFAGGNWPSSVCIHQQRLWLGGGKLTPASLFASRTGDFESFRKAEPIRDDDALEYVLASGSVDDIRWLVPFGGELLIGTAGAEYKASSSKAAAITPSDCQISAQSYWGSRNLQPLLIGQSIIHCQRADSHLRDLYYSLETDGYTGNDLSVLNPSMFEGKSRAIIQWCYQQSPQSRIWCLRDDGTLICLTYLREQNVWAWSRHTLGGHVTSIACLPGDGQDVLMMVVRRQIQGKNRYYLERMKEGIGTVGKIANAWYVDSGIEIQLRDGGTTHVGGLEHLAGCEVAVNADGTAETHTVKDDGTLDLDRAAGHVIIGLPYDSVLAPLPVETDIQGHGSTLGKRRAYGKVLLRLYRSVGGQYAATSPGDLWNESAWKETEHQWFELPYLPEQYDAPTPLFSGDMELHLPGGQDQDASIWIKTSGPLPLRVVAIMADVDFGEQ